MSEKIELKWIEPDEWGPLAWTLLFAATTQSRAEEEKEEENYREWENLIKTLPFILPCYSCRHCCATYLRSNPFPNYNNGIGPKLEWLIRLRHDIQTRNKRTSRESELHEEMRPEKLFIETQNRFLERLRYPRLCRLDIWLFLGSVIRTLDWSTPIAIDQFHQFISSLWFLLGKSVFLAEWKSPPPSSHTKLNNAEEAMKWLCKNHKDSIPIFVSILDSMKVQSRWVKRSEP